MKHHQRPIPSFQRSSSSSSSRSVFPSPSEQNTKHCKYGIYGTTTENFGFHLLQELPHEMMYLIFNFLSVRECCKNVSAVNRWFKSMIDKYLSSGQVRELNICREV